MVETEEGVVVWPWDEFRIWLMVWAFGRANWVIWVIGPRATSSPISGISIVYTSQTWMLGMYQGPI